MPGTVIILGAGATKSVDTRAPETKDLLPGVYKKIDQLGQEHFRDFLKDVFHVSPDAAAQDFPGLPMLMSLLDTALDRKQPLQANWDAARMRHAVEVGIFEVLEDVLKMAPTNNHYELLQKVYPNRGEPYVISLNYDLVIDAAMMHHSANVIANVTNYYFPNYYADIQTEFYRAAAQRFGTLLKLHGSLNWLYCTTCQHLEIGASESMKWMTVAGKALGEVAVDLKAALLTDGSECPVCKTKMRPLLITPTHMKDYRNPHLGQVWYHAERVLRQCDRAIIVGYSLPDDDVEVIYLLKRGLAHLAPKQITVVQKDDKQPALKDSETGRRYRALFGDVDWHTNNGLDGWLRIPAAAVAGS
jgi:hypothetical protein